MKKIFVISDLHLGHENIIKLCNRPFKNVDEMNDTIINNWNNVVGKEDIVYVVGDFAYKGKNAKEYIKRLNGEIILITGNHDKYIPEIKTYKYYELELDGVKYVLSHYPIISWNGMFKESILLYGHVHSTGQDWEFVKHKNAYNVCLEFHDYTPVEITKFKPKKLTNGR